MIESQLDIHSSIPDNWWLTAWHATN